MIFLEKINQATELEHIIKFQLFIHLLFTKRSEKKTNFTAIRRLNVHFTAIHIIIIISINKQTECARALKHYYIIKIQQNRFAHIIVRSSARARL